MKIASKMWAVVTIPLLLVSCSAPGADTNAENEEPVTLTTTVTSGELPAESTSTGASTRTTEPKKQTEVDPQKFSRTNSYGTQMWVMEMRGGDVVCLFDEYSTQAGALCQVKNWENAPRNVVSDPLLFGAEDDIILGDQSGFAPAKLTTMPDIGGYPVPLNPGEKTSIQGYEISVDEDDVVTVRRGSQFFTFDGTLTTDSWSQHPDANGWLDPGNVCRRDKGPLDDDRVFFAGSKGGNCEANLETFRKYGEALNNGEGGGNIQGVKKPGWECSLSTSYATGISTSQGKEWCETYGQGEIWVTDPTKSL